MKQKLKQEIHLIEAIDGENPYDMNSEHLGLGYLASYAENFGNYSNIKIYKSAGNLKFEKKPEVIGITSVTQNFEVVKKLVKKIKETDKNIQIILGGIHVSLLPLSAPKETDFVVVGEGEQIFLDILNYVFQKKGNPSKIKGLFYRKGKKLTFTGKRELIKNIDSIPTPKRNTELLKKRKAQLFTSRGCPYKCPFCSSSKMWSSTRFHSTKYILKEMEYLIEKQNINNIIFADDLVIANRKRFREMCSEFVKKGWNKKVTFSLHVRANLVNPELVKLLKSINVTSVGMGIESGSERMLKIIKYGTVSLEQNYNSVKLLEDAKIEVSGYFLLGYPGEKIEDIELTKQFILKSKLTQGEAFLTLPYPGTELWNIALKKKIVSENMNWNKFRTDFEKNPENAIVISDLNIKKLLKKYLEFKKLFLYKQIQFSGGFFPYMKKLNYLHFKQLILNPRKAVYAFKTILNLIRFRK